MYHQVLCEPRLSTTAGIYQNKSLATGACEATPETGGICGQVKRDRVIWEGNITGQRYTDHVLSLLYCPSYNRITGPCFSTITQRPIQHLVLASLITRLITYTTLVGSHWLSGRPYNRRQLAQDLWEERCRIPFLVLWHHLLPVVELGRTSMGMTDTDILKNQRDFSFDGWSITDPILQTQYLHFCSNPRLNQPVYPLSLEVRKAGLSHASHSFYNPCDH